MLLQLSCQLLQRARGSIYGVNNQIKREFSQMHDWV